MGLESVDPAAVEEFASAVGLVVRRIRANAGSDLHDFSWTQKQVITRLDKGGPVTIADLARAEGIKPQSMGTAVATLEEKGFVERKPHPTDGRQMLVKLSAKGTAFRRNLTRAKHEWLTRCIGELDKQEQATLWKAGTVLKRLAEMP